VVAEDAEIDVFVEQSVQALIVGDEPADRTVTVKGELMT
jgi:hypothetical protein